MFKLQQKYPENWNWGKMRFRIVLQMAFTIVAIGNSSEETLKPNEEIFDWKYENQSARIGTNFRLKCGVPQGALKFLTVDGKIPRGEKYKLLLDSNLLIKNVSSEDYEKEYLCHAIIPEREDVPSMQIHLRNVKESNSIHTEDDGRILEVGTIGEIKTLTCSVYARPYPTFSWFFDNGTRIENRTDFIVTENEDTSNLTIFIRNPDHFNDYHCQAENVLGKMEQYFRLALPEKPMGVPFIYPKSIGLSQITIAIKNSTWKKNFEVVLQYKERDEGRSSAWKLVPHTKIDHEKGTVQVTGLKEGSSYMFRAAFKEAFILGDFSESLIVTTDRSEKSRTTLSNDELQFSKTDSKGRSLNFSSYPEIFNELFHSDRLNGVTLNSTIIKSKTYRKVNDNWIVSTKIVEKFGAMPQGTM